jgi:hypothetical protein
MAERTLMELQHVNVKLYVEKQEKIEQEKFTPIFHRWIQEKLCDELLIDVADYLHVDAGPGIVLIGNEADYSMDNTDHRLGLRYNRKAHTDGNNQDRFNQALKAALLAAQRLEAEALLKGKIKFIRNELDLFINDRALAPNTIGTFESCKSELEKFFQTAFNENKFTMTHNPNPLVRFGVSVKFAKSFEFEEVLKKLL